MSNEVVRVELRSQQFDCDPIQLRKLTGREAISQPFRFECEIVSTASAELTEEEVLGAEASLVFEEQGVEARTIHGVISEFDDLLDSETAFHSYRLVLVPRAHRLTLVETQEIFMGMSVPDIAKAKLELVGLGAQDVDFRLSDTYPARDFVVEYRETDLAFLSRLTEHLGMSFFFEHKSGTDKIVFTDQSAGFQPIEGEDKIPFRFRGERRFVHRIERCSRVFPAAYVVQDYNYRTPQIDLTSTYEIPGGGAGGVVEYGTHQRTPDEGNRLARARADEREARCRYYVGEADICRFSAGATFELQDHPRLGDRRLLLVEVTHELTQAVLTHGGGPEQDVVYRSTFRAVEASTRYRPPRITPRPRIFGVLTAKVEAEKGETPGILARIDEQGRYLLRFVFDTGSFTRPRPSRPIRMLQPHAGVNYGMHLPLKPGVEVLVAFVDGDPDRPLIVGAVPNPLTPSPVTGANPEMHTIKTANGLAIYMKDL